MVRRIRLCGAGKRIILTDFDLMYNEGNARMSTDDLSRAELVEQSFDCCMQAVRSYQSGRFDSLDDITRKHLIGVMLLFKQAALKKLTNLAITEGSK